MKLTLPALSAVILLLFSQYPASGQNYLRLRAITHISSTVSEGRYSLSQIVEAASKNNIDVIIPTDRFNMRWEYGLTGLRKIINKTITHNSVLTYGVARYLDDIKRLDEQFEDILVIPGVEAAPHYYWQGSFFKNNLTMSDWHKHLLAIGMENEAGYSGLPVIGLPDNLKQSFSFIKLWPVIVIIAGFYFLKRKMYRYSDEKGRPLGPDSKAARVIGIGFIFLGSLFFINNWPFYDYFFDQYNNYQDLKPYQNFIDYVHSNGGLTFWAHPEAGYIQTQHGVSFETFSHPEDLFKTDNYTGFTAFREGNKKIAAPLGLWDDLLLDYVRGKRSSFAAAMAGLAFEKGDLEKALVSTVTVILVQEKSRNTVIEAMRKGRMYAVEGRGAMLWDLSEFYIKNEGGLQKAHAGDTIFIDDHPILRLKAVFAGEPVMADVKIIRNKEIIFEDSLSTPVKLDFADITAPAGVSYYRLEIKSKTARIFTNPIFVEKSGD